MINLEELNASLDSIDNTYEVMIQIVNQVINPILNPINEYVNKVTENGNNMTVDQIREAILTLQLKAFEISEIRDKSLLKSNVADALLKEQFAIQYGTATGSQEARKESATLNTSEENFSKQIYMTASDLLKTKVDQLHRLVDALKSILMSKMQEAKFMQLGATSEITSTTSPTGMVNLHNMDERRFN